MQHECMQMTIAGDCRAIQTSQWPLKHFTSLPLWPNKVGKLPYSPEQVPQLLSLMVALVSDGACA